VLAGIVLVVWIPNVTVPRPLQRFVALIASASLYIYLTHWQVFPPIARAHGPAVAVIGASLVGVVVWCVARRVIDRSERALRAARPTAGVPAR
jgi:hypothetical protein